MLQIKEQYEGEEIEKGPHYTPDPRGVRTGNGCGEPLKTTLERVCLDAEAAISAVRDKKSAGTLVHDGSS